MMRDYKYIDRYLDILKEDVYTQPSDEGHIDWTKDFIQNFLPEDVTSVIDVGCGDGYSITLFPQHIYWFGITIDDEEIALGKKDGIFIRKADFSFLDMVDDEVFDVVFARHVLEHSPMPLLTLMEWYRISNKWLMVVLPAADYWEVGGRNHYYVLPKENWWYLFDRAGWEIIKEDEFTTSRPLFIKHLLPEQKDRSKVKWEGRPKVVEFRYLLRKK